MTVGLPVLRLTVEPGRVDLETPATRVLPGTDLHIEPGSVTSRNFDLRPFDVTMRTDPTTVFPATWARIRPFDVQLSAGNRRMRIRPFLITFDR